MVMIRSGRHFNLCGWVKEKEQKFPDQVRCNSLTGLVLDFGGHMQICVENNNGDQFSVGLTVDGIHVKKLNKFQHLNQPISSLRGGIPRDVINGKTDKLRELKKILLEIVSDKDKVNVVHISNSAIVPNQPCVYNFGKIDCKEFIIKLLILSGYDVKSLGLMGAFALRYRSDGSAYGESLNG